MASHVSAEEDEARRKLDPRWRPLRAGEKIATVQGVGTVGSAQPAPPRGYRRCWWCCLGRLIADDDDVEAEHRFSNHPELADPERRRLERSNDADDDARAALERERSGSWETVTAGWRHRVV